MPVPVSMTVPVTVMRNGMRNKGRSESLYWKVDKDSNRVISLINHYWGKDMIPRRLMCAAESQIKLENGVKTARKGNI